MIREIKSASTLIKKNTAFRIFILLFFTIFLYLFYGLYNNKISPFVFRSNTIFKTDEFLSLLSKNICPLFFYLFSLFFVVDISYNILHLINPIKKIRDRGVVNKLFAHLFLTGLYSVIIVLVMNFIYYRIGIVATRLETLIYAILLILLLLFIVSFFGAINVSSIGYAIDIVLLSVQPIFNVNISKKNFLFLCIIIILFILNYFCYKNKETIGECS